MNKNEQFKIIVNFPSNIGDTIMCLPALDRLRENFPCAKITAIAVVSTADMLNRHSFVNEVLVYDKHWPKMRQLKFAMKLIGKYKIFADFKNTLLPLISLSPRWTSFLRFWPKKQHAREYYEAIITKLAPRPNITRGEFIFNEQEYVRFDELGISKSIFIASASRSIIKRYKYSALKCVVEELVKQTPITLIGEDDDRYLYRDIAQISGVKSIAGKTKIADLFFLLKKYCKLLIAVDSSVLHIAGYLGIPSIALFGPTDFKHYGPWGKNDTILTNKKSRCQACGQAACALATNECMDIAPETIITFAQNFCKE